MYTVNVNGETWTIEFVSSSDYNLMRSDGTYTIGVCDDETKTIYIDKTLNNTYLQKVLCHEITHAAMFSYDINLSLEQEELLADLLATYGEEVVQKANILFKRIKENRGSY